MGRPTRNPTHILARLRNQLSTDAHQVTRKELAKIAGIPQTSLRDIELGKFKMTEEVATRLSYATGVNPRSLLAGEDPLLDFGGQPLTNESYRLPEVIWARPEHREMEEQLFASVMDAAREKKIAKVISFSFETWILKTIQSFGLESLFAEKLTEKLLLFDPSLVPFEFRPKDKRALKAWEDLECVIDRRDRAKAIRPKLVSGKRPPSPIRREV